jgi:alkylation response protein AidB-like acyl-CoA dehydrogenase
VDREAVRGLARTAASFTDRFVQPLIAAAGPDGDLGSLPDVLSEAALVGLLATAEEEGAGYEYGVWGTSCLSDGPAASLAVLEEVARRCAGVACCLHAAGLGAAELAGSRVRGGRVAAALLEETWRLDRWPPTPPPVDVTTIHGGAAEPRVSGRKGFVLAPPGCEGFVVYGAGEQGWQPVLLPRDAPGLEVEEIGRRTGLAAVQICRLRLAEVPIQAGHLLPPRPPGALLARLWLGLAAIALGNARGALVVARQYAADRYQGGDQIEVHPAVRELLGEAASRIAAGAGLLGSAAEGEAGGADGLWRAAAAKLRITVDGCQAVSDCLQVLGGSGYTEEVRLEKRLRDAITLKVLAGSPGELRRLVGSAGGGQP